ncbi:MAG: phosphoenolpyruvate synthase, partial [Cyanobacteriota bacterium]|nr:phosphoenolpyruvate synthase [Cyanobacteriota bacterium]
MLKTKAVKKARSTKQQALVLWFDEVGIGDISLVGGKNASLGETIKKLTPKGINVPNGFAITAYAYRYFLKSAGLEAKLRQIFADLDTDNLNNLRQRGQEARSLILSAQFPQELQMAIASNYEELCARYGKDTDVAVRSSATAEDLPDASFAGQQDTYLNVRGISGVLEATQKCIASVFADRAISYRTRGGFDHFDVALAVGIQKMVRSDLATSGVMFSIDTETGFKNAVLITAAYGLGENVVQGAVNPDEYLVFKPTLREGFRPILNKRLGSKALQMVYDRGSHQPTKNIEVPLAQQKEFALNDDEILQLARWAVVLEDHYSQKNRSYTPMDVEWAKDGVTGELFVVQARPETVQSRKSGNVVQTYKMQQTGKILSVGRAVGEAIASGKVRAIFDVNNIDEFQEGEILVTNKTDPDWEPIMKKARAIVTDRGGRTCHAAIIAREMGIPAIVGCGDATDILTTGEKVTVCCAEGEEGKVYQDLLPFEVEETVLDELPETRTKILTNVGNPELAFHLSEIPSDGVGLARLEFIIANHIKVHPMALIRFDELRNPTVKQKIAEMTAGYRHKPDFFVEKLAYGIATIAAAFYPKQVIVRTSDFKSNEYANLLGGSQFEPEEENPMIGWRGASRYYDPKYQQAFGLECQALKMVRDEMGLANVIPMIPFCRTPEEGRKVLAEMEKYGLKRGKNGLQVYVMCELPSNVILADEFSEVFDGFSIGSNDLTQLTLGL